MSDFMAYPRFISLELTWNPPQLPNGIIIAYMVTYVLNAEGPDSVSIAMNVTDGTTLVVPDLLPWTKVSDISITPYTSAGKGIISWLPPLENLKGGTKARVDFFCI